MYESNLHQYESIGAHWIALNVTCDNVTYFDSVGVQNIPKEIKNFIDNRNIQQAFDQILCGCFCIGFKSLLEHTNLFSPGEYESNDEVMLKHFQ